VQVDITLMEKDLRQAGNLAADAERSGHDGVWCTETGVDPFLQAYEAVRRTSRVQVGTAIAVALARNPMTVAYSAWNLAGVSDGRFILGLGSQVKAHVERRYSMPWRNAVGQMREFAEATRAIFAAWRSGEKLDFQGDHYTHTLMSPFWEPAPHTHDIPIWLAAVGPKMTKMAGAVADGVLLHTFTNAAYLEKVAFPTLDEGLREAGRETAAVELSIPLFMVMGDSEEEIARRREQAVKQLAFYASTPAYRPVLDAIGEGDLQPELTAMSKRGEWDAMPSLITDDLLAHFAVIGTPEQMPELARRHLGPRVTRVTSYFGWPVEDQDRLREILAGFDQEKGAA
jgi:probable F420-dependent oxidoreductase